MLKYLKDEECIGETVRKANSLAHSLLEVDEFPFNKYWFCDGSYFKKIMAQLVFNCPLLPTPQNNLARKRPMTSESLATPLVFWFILFEIFTRMIYEIFFNSVFC
jgi:hypothetical protein